jgi:hypothetical protein
MAWLKSKWKVFQAMWKKWKTYPQFVWITASRTWKYLYLVNSYIASDKRYEQCGKVIHINCGKIRENTTTLEDIDIVI